MAELIVLLVVLPFFVAIGVIAGLALLDIFVLPGILPPSSWGRQFLRWVGASYWRCAGLIALGVGMTLLYLWCRGGA